MFSFVFVSACFDFSLWLGWFSFTVKLLYAFLVFVSFLANYAVSKLLEVLVGESFNGKQTSTKTPFFVTKGGEICTPGKISVNQQRLTISD